ncbi:MAG: nucleotidyltransferase family protein [Elusimicrobia bacterium]|nr:nucleotidyltransferase family protein [Elusimicrobiota bacterium]
MNFKKTLTVLIKEFEKQEINYALIGGFAMGILGVPRNTIDIDFLVSSEKLNKIENLMLALGYKKVFSSENISQYVSPLEELGEVDFLHAFRPISLRMLKEATKSKIFDNKLEITVLKPEDIIGLKIQAIANNPSRLHKDFSDIEELVKNPKIDWLLIENYFELFDMRDKFEHLKEKYGKK